METSTLSLLDPNFQEQLYLLPSSTAIQPVPQEDPIPQMETSSSLSLLSPDVQEQLYLLPSSIADESAPQNDSISQMETSSHSFLNSNIQEQLYLLPPPQPMINQPQGPQEDIQNQSQPKLAPTSSGSSPQPVEYSIKKTNPVLGGGQVIGGRVVNSRKASTYDLVERMQFLFVRVVKAQNLPLMDITGKLDPFVEVGVGNYKGITGFSETSNPEWNAVFAFSKESMQASILDVVVKDKDMIEDDCFGMVHLNIDDILLRVPTDSQLAPEWYRLEDKNGNKMRAELMLAVWIGIQADEAFPDAAMSNVDSSVSSMFLRSQVYHSPTLWYVRVNVIKVQDLVWAEETRIPDVCVKVQINNQISRTKSVKAKTANALWNEDLMFVAAEPFEDHLILIVEDRVGPGQDEVLGRIFIPLSSVERRVDDRTVPSRWFNLQKPHGYESDEEETKKDKFATRVHLRVSLDGGYHVHDESTQYSSDLRPTAKELWKPSIGILEVGILNASVLQPMKSRDGKGTADAYCVAKYGHQWVRTRTVVDNLSPRFNEQFTWEVYDMSTVITVGLFDNGQIENGNSRDARIGKIRVRISTLETGRVYTHSYPLLVLHPRGVTKMGELNLAIRFSSTSMINMMMMYSKPLLPKMHYAKPLTLVQHEMLRHRAVGIVAARLSRVEPPLRREIVEYITDADLNPWSMRRSKENFYRVISVFNGANSVGKWFEKVCLWKNPTTTIIVHILFPTPVVFPELIIPMVFLCMFLIGLWNYQFGAHYPPHIKYPHEVNEDELDEEFDTFPTSRSPEYVRYRYDRLRGVAGRIQQVVGDIASQGERLLGLLCWRDPRATVIFLGFCLVAAFVVYATPFQVLVILSGFYVMRHPRFRHRYPSATLNFFRRLPPRTDNML